MSQHTTHSLYPLEFKERVKLSRRKKANSMPLGFCFTKIAMKRGTAEALHRTVKPRTFFISHAYGFQSKNAVKWLTTCMCQMWLCTDHLCIEHPCRQPTCTSRWARCTVKDRPWGLKVRLWPGQGGGTDLCKVIGASSGCAWINRGTGVRVTR